MKYKNMINNKYYNSVKQSIKKLKYKLKRRKLIMTEEQKLEYFENSEVNQKLLKLFESKWGIVEKVCNAVNDEELWTVLHLACVPPNYEKMKYKILIVGQENDGWGMENNARLSMFATLDFLASKDYNDIRPFFSFPYKFCKSINNLEDIQDSKKHILLGLI